MTSNTIFVLLPLTLVGEGWGKGSVFKNAARKGKTMKRLMTICAGMMLAQGLWALTFPMPPEGNDIIGELRTIHSTEGQKIYDIAQANDMGFYEMIEANPSIYRHSEISVNTPIVIPSEFLLPDAPREGIVVNLPELRLYYYPKGENTVVTYPLAIGKYEWITPTIVTKVIEKQKNPVWFVPKSIQKAAAEKGIIWPDVVPPGPKNPLGKFALRLGNRSYLIHGTSSPQSIGKRASSGCMRMYPDDIEALFNAVPVGTPVRIVNEWYKLGWRNGYLYIEIHEPLQETALPRREAKVILEDTIQSIADKYNITIDYAVLKTALEDQTGLPVKISTTPVAVGIILPILNTDEYSVPTSGKVEM